MGLLSNAHVVIYNTADSLFRIRASTGIKEPLIQCDSGMQGKASRSETRSVSSR